MITASTNCTTCRGSSISRTATRTAPSSKWAAASASTCCGSRRAGRGSPASTWRDTSIDLARKNFELHGIATNNGDGRAQLQVANGEALPFPDNSFDVVYGHGVIQYTADARKLITECRRVLKPGGQAIFMVYNRVSWLNAMSKVTRVDLEHEDAPVLNKYSIAEFRDLLRDFSKVEIIPERFPVASRLHRGVKALLFNTVFVGAFNALPKSLVRRYGWHLMAFCVK